MLIIVTGKSASGKDTAVQELLKDKRYTKIIQMTSRPPRPNEVNSKEYEFTTNEEIERNKKKLIGIREFNVIQDGKQAKWIYAIQKSRINKNTDKIKVLITDLLVANEIKSTSTDKVKIVYLNCSDEIRTNRARKREGFELEEWNRRLIADAKDFSDDLVARCDSIITVDNDISITEIVNRIKDLTK